MVSEDTKDIRTNFKSFGFEHLTFEGAEFDYFVGTVAGYLESEWEVSTIDINDLVKILGYRNNSPVEKTRMIEARSGLFAVLVPMAMVTRFDVSENRFITPESNQAFLEALLEAYPDIYHQQTAKQIIREYYQSKSQQVATV